MKTNRLILFTMSLASIGLSIFFYNSTVTPLDRPFLLAENEETIIATKVSWMCNCANFVDTLKYNTNPVIEPDDNDYFFIEAAQPDQEWNRGYFINNKYVKLTGHFYIDKGIPEEYEFGHLEDKPDHARVFRFDKIEYLTDND